MSMIPVATIDSNSWLGESPVHLNFSTNVGKITGNERDAFGIWEQDWTGSFEQSIHVWSVKRAM